MSRDSFERQLALGMIGERMVAAWAKARGCGVIPSYEYSGDDSSKAPRMMFEHAGLAIPDLDVCGGGRRTWIEVKSYARPWMNRRHRALVHGIGGRLARDYAAVAAESGCPVFLFVLEIVSGELLSLRLGKHPHWPCQCRGCSGGPGSPVRPCAAEFVGGPRRGHYWPRALFDLRHKFTDEEMTEIRSAHLLTEAA